MNLLLCVLIHLQGAPAQDPVPPKQDPPAVEPATLQVPLVEKATLGGQIRLRAEMKDPVDYRIPGTNGRAATEDVSDGDEYLLLRTRLHIDLIVKKGLRAFVQIQDSRAFGDEFGAVTPATAPSTAATLGNVRGVDVHQAYVEAENLFDEPLAVRLGRLELPQLGDGRLVSHLDWHNVGRSWDGAMATFTPKDFWVAAMAAVLNESTGTDGADDAFYGLYASYRGFERHEIDAYVFGRDFRRDVTGELGPTGDLFDQTFGVRLKGATAGFDYTAEVAFQRGDWAEDAIEAMALVATLGYTFADVPWKPRLGVEASRASGDDDPTDGDRGTFDPLFSFGHAYHGFYDLLLWKNARTFMVSASAKPADWLTVVVDTHVLRLDEDRDGWYGVPVGALIRRDATGNAGNEIGWEVDVHAKVKCGERVDVWAGVSHFEPGGFVEDTGSSPAGTWVFAQMTVKF
jgi:hypothetical protein